METHYAEMLQVRCFFELRVCCCHGAMIFTRTIQPVVDGVEIQQHLLLHGVVE